MAFYGVGNRKTEFGQDRIDQIMEGASSAGIDVVEIQYTKPALGSDMVSISGYDVPIVVENDSTDFSGNYSVSVKWIKDGRLKFYPDGRGRRWGYIALTEKNKKLMAHSVQDNWYRIIDGKMNTAILEKIEDLKESGHIKQAGALEAVEEHINLTKLEKAEKLKEDMDTEIAALKKKLAEAEASAKPPLKGVKIKPAKVGAKGKIGEKV